MCLAPKAPQMPPPPPAPAPTPLPEPPPPAPVTVAPSGGAAAPVVARPTSQRAAKRQAGRGPSALAIPMGGSSSGPSAATTQTGGGGTVKLNIGK
jgi:hypothetical protein